MHEALGVSPSQVVLGRKLGTVGYMEEEHKVIDFTHMQFVQRVKYALNKVQSLISKKRAEKIQKNWDLNPVTNPTVFEIGDKVGLIQYQLID